MQAYQCDTQSRAVQNLNDIERSTGPVIGKCINKIRFLAKIPRQNTQSGSFRTHTGRCEFSRGLGPCGRLVTGLWLDLSTSFLTVIQESYEVDSHGRPFGPPELKEFIYLFTDVIGRIEAVSSDPS